MRKRELFIKNYLDIPLNLILNLAYRRITSMNTFSINSLQLCCLFRLRGVLITVHSIIIPASADNICQRKEWIRGQHLSLI